MTEMTRAERAKLAEVIEYIAANENKLAIGAIKKKFNLTDDEYETALDLAMPAIRAYCRSRAWKGQFLKFLRELMCMTTPMKGSKIDRRLQRLYDPDPDARLWNLEHCIEETFHAFLLSGGSAEQALDRRLAREGSDE